MFLQKLHVQLFTINQIYNELSDLEANSSAAGWSLAWHRHELTSEGPWCQGLTWTPGGGWSDSTRGQAETLVISVQKSIVPQKVPSEVNPKVRNHGEGPY